MILGFGNTILPGRAQSVIPSTHPQSFLFPGKPASNRPRLAFHRPFDHPKEFGNICGKFTSGGFDLLDQLLDRMSIADEFAHIAAVQPLVKDLDGLLSVPFSQERFEGVN
ncbi:hypothetical protein Pla8534_18710 [Lignipirellula cremea]|uniref:Uncharacterized protein n=2 Tax=Lignipirellula cremea TaxID=2528010 RepID=A0A518DQH1_9BACT|nr:hypothetical protein Pla8534_18710 [Lignipirellula cremea]